MLKRSKLYQKCRKLRAAHPGVSPACILHWARARTPLALDWCNGRARLKRSGFDIEARWRMDECGDVSYLGEFSRTPGEEGFRVDPRNTPGKPGYHAQWPQDEYGEICFYIPHNSPREAARELWERHGYSKGVAWALAQAQMRQDAQRLAEYWAGARAQYYLTVTASRHGVELGGDSLGGIDVDREAEFDNIIEENNMIENAIREARSALAELRKCKAR
jgi:hypothetical protein